MVIDVTQFVICVETEHAEETKEILEEYFVGILEVEVSENHKRTRFYCETNMERYNTVYDRLNETDYFVWLFPNR